MSASFGQAALTDRMMRAARLESQLYEEVEHDLTATTQALTVVVAAAVAAGIGHAIGELMGGHPTRAIGGFVFGVVTGLLGWALWSGLAYLIGTKVFNGVATYGECLRTIGFAHSPGVLNILSFIPFLGGLLRIAVGIWILIATIIAMRQALDIDTTKAILTAVIGFVAYVGVTLILSPLFILAGLVSR